MKQNSLTINAIKCLKNCYFQLHVREKNLRKRKQIILAIWYIRLSLHYKESFYHIEKELLLGREKLEYFSHISNVR